MIGTNVQGYNTNLQQISNNTWLGASTINTVGTITTGTWNGSVIDIAHGGTGQTTAATAINALLPTQTGISSGEVLAADGSGNLYWTSVGSGTVTSVAMTGDGTIFNTTVSGSPITSAGTLQQSLNLQLANKVFAANEKALLGLAR